MIIEGSHHCEHCGYNYNWCYQVPQKIEATKIYDVEVLQKEKIKLHRVYKTIEKDGYMLPLEAGAYCPNCNQLNKIILQEIEK